mmetsp:Transcript_22606/g.57496  ORF Transcript_22606/g.57496 Transcript_22606/m.57496 type:complete len:560 (-) Transcript_22606:273-1952(-)
MRGGLHAHAGALAAGHRHTKEPKAKRLRARTTTYRPLECPPPTLTTRSASLPDALLLLLPSRSEHSSSSRQVMHAEPWAQHASIRRDTRIWCQPGKGQGQSVVRGTAGGLASAALLLAVLAAALGDAEDGELLRNGGVDADAVVKVRLGGARLHGHSQALDDLAGLGAQVVHANDALLVSQVRDELAVHLVVAAHGLALMLLVVQRPLQGLEVRHVHLDAVLAVARDGVLLAQAHAAVLERREHHGGHRVVVHLQLAAVVEALRQPDAGLDGHGGQLLPALQHVTQRVHRRHVGLLVGGGDLAGLLVVRHAGGVQAQVQRHRVAPHRQQHRVVLLVRVKPKLGVLVRGLDLATLGALKLGGGAAADEHHALLLHVLADGARHLLVKATQRDGAHHDVHGEAQRVQQAGALQRDVRRANHQRLAGGCGQREEVVRRDAQLLVARHAQVARAAAHRNDHALRGQRLLLPVLLGGLHRVRVHQPALGVDVLDALLAQSHLVAPVEATDVVLHGGGQLLPLVRNARLGQLPAKGARVRERLTQQASLVHELLGDAAHIDAGAT